MKWKLKARQGDAEMQRQRMLSGCSGAMQCGAVHAWRMSARVRGWRQIHLRERGAGVLVVAWMKASLRLKRMV